MAKRSKGPQKALSKYELDSVDLAILNLRRKHIAITDKDIAEIIGLSRKQVNERQQTEKFKKAIHEAFQEPVDILESGMKMAANVMLRSLASKDERVAQNAAKLMLVSKGALKERLDIEAHIIQPPSIIVLEGHNEEIHIGNTGAKLALPVVEISEK